MFPGTGDCFAPTVLLDGLTEDLTEEPFPAAAFPGLANEVGADPDCTPGFVAAAGCVLVAFGGPPLGAGAIVAAPVPPADELVAAAAELATFVAVGPMDQGFGGKLAPAPGGGLAPAPAVA